MAGRFNRAKIGSIRRTPIMVRCAFFNQRGKLDTPRLPFGPRARMEKARCD